MEIMELRQELREAGRVRDVARIQGLADRVKVTRATTLTKLERAFTEVAPLLLKSSSGALSMQTPDETWKTSVYGLLSELRYFRRFFDEAEAYLDEI